MGGKNRLGNKRERRGGGSGGAGGYFGLILINLEHFKFNLMSFVLYLLVFSLFVN